MSVIINASTSAGLVMTSDLSGVLTLQQNGVSLPNGGVAPTFSAYQSSAQSITGSTFTKVQFQTKSSAGLAWDTNNNYDNVTNYRFTPTVAGYYQINSVINFPQTNGTNLLSIYKNGTEYKRGVQSFLVATTGGGMLGLNVSGLVYCNGSTDYIEIFAYIGATQTLVASTLTYFDGCLVRGA